ncbi:MAG: ComEA family DNA-binding protein [Leptolyngbya sp. SIO4C1]|nr:ComEA family DNA-binding protein [Leptolyngbya sp. SIO4C1]
MRGKRSNQASWSRWAADGLSRLEQRFSSLQSRLQQPYYRFQSLAEVDEAARLGWRIDVNQATVDDWLRFPVMSIHQARTLAQLTQAGVMLTCLEDVAAAANLPMSQLQPIAPVLQFCYYDWSHQPRSVKANQASLAELMQVPAIDYRFAQAVLYHRQQCPFRDLADFQQRLQLSPQLTAEVLHYLQF